MFVRLSFLDWVPARQFEVLSAADSFVGKATFARDSWVFTWPCRRRTCSCKRRRIVDGRNRIRLTNGFRRFVIRMFGTRRLVGVLGNALLIRRVCWQLSFALIDIIEIFEFVLPNCKLWLMYYL